MPTATGASLNLGKGSLHCKGAAQHGLARLVVRWTRALMTLSTTNTSSTVGFGKCSLQKIAVDRHLAVKLKRSGIPAVTLGPALAPCKASQLL